MTRAEHDFYDALLVGVGNEFRIFAQVHLDCLLEPTSYGRDRLYAFRHINQKSVDFVLCDRQLRTVLAIELDDSSHNRPDRVQRDQLVESLLKEGGVPLLRISHNKVYEPQVLATRIREAISLAKNPPTSQGEKDGGVSHLSHFANQDSDRPLSNSPGANPPENP